MNTYRVSIRLCKWNVAREYDVDASRPGEAIRRALTGFPDSPTVEASCRLFAKDVRHDYADPKVRAV